MVIEWSIPSSSDVCFHCQGRSEGCTIAVNGLRSSNLFEAQDVLWFFVLAERCDSGSSSCRTNCRRYDTHNAPTICPSSRNCEVASHWNQTYRCFIELSWRGHGQSWMTERIRTNVQGRPSRPQSSQLNSSYETFYPTTQLLRVHLQKVNQQQPCKHHIDSQDPRILKEE